MKNRNPRKTHQRKAYRLRPGSHTGNSLEKFIASYFEKNTSKFTSRITREISHSILSLLGKKSGGAGGPAASFETLLSEFINPGDLDALFPRSTGGGGLLSSLFGQPGGGGLLGGLLGKQGGAAGLKMLGAAQPWLAMAGLAAQLLSRGPGAPLADVASLPQFENPTIIDGGINPATASQAQIRAAFSSRNAAGGRLLNSNTTSAAELSRLKAEIKSEHTSGWGASDDAVRARMVDIIRRGAVGGVPRRTGFTHG